MNKEDALDRLKLDIFKDRRIGVLFGALLCNVEWVWDNSILTAATNMKKIMFNEDFFMSMSREEQLGVALHELNHIFRLHQIRKGDRDHRLWNIACDYVINSALKTDNFSLPEGVLYEPDLVAQLVTEEDIYEHLLENNPNMECSPFGVEGDEGDMKEPENGTIEPKEVRDLVETVAKAINQAKMQDIDVGNMTSSIEQYIKDFVNPEIPWNKALRKHMNDIGNIRKLSWKRRNRRYRNMYMPSRIKDENRLKNVLFFLDTSGSVSDNELMKYLSEIKYVQEVLKPRKLEVIQFDYEIQKVDSYTEGKRITGMDIKGRGGTDLRPVYDYIKKSKASAVVVFSDLECPPMTDPEIPVYWIIPENTYGHSPDYGKVFTIKGA